jgi:DNA invertase Pin-like site-specific DNA recombinase
MDGALLMEFTEVESGRSGDRPQLAAALMMCKRTGAILLIAKLDRLARNVAFIANLLESGAKFTALDMPNADRFMMHVYAAMAEEEGRRIGERTRMALAAAKARGVKLGVNGKVLADKNRKIADEFSYKMMTTFYQVIVAEALSYKRSAERLNDLGVPSATGGVWHATTVFRVWQRIKSSNNKLRV